MACYRGESAAAVEMSRAALSDLPETDSFWRGCMTINMSLNMITAERSREDLSAMRSALSENEASSARNGDHHNRVFSISKIGDLERLQGRLQDAARTFSRAIQLVEGEYHGKSLAVAARAYVGLGLVLYERNDVEGARYQRSAFATSKADASQSWS